MTTATSTGSNRPLVLEATTPGVASLRLASAVGSKLTFGRDTQTTPVEDCLGIKSMQVSRQQGRLQRSQNGTLELFNLGIGHMRIVRPPATSGDVLRQHQGPVRLLLGDNVQLLEIVRACKCPTSQPCKCAAGKGDEKRVLVSWKVKPASLSVNRQPQRLPAEASIGTIIVAAPTADTLAAVHAGAARSTPADAPAPATFAPAPAASAPATAADAPAPAATPPPAPAAPAPPPRSAPSAPPPPREAPAPLPANSSGSGSQLARIGEVQKRLTQAQRVAAELQALAANPGSPTAHLLLKRVMTEITLAARAAESAAAMHGDGAAAAASAPAPVPVPARSTAAPALVPALVPAPIPAPPVEPPLPSDAIKVAPAPPVSLSSENDGMAIVNVRKGEERERRQRGISNQAVPPSQVPPSPVPPSPSVAVVPPACGAWRPDDVFEAERLDLSDRKSSKGWVQCDRCSKWRPPLEPEECARRMSVGMGAGMHDSSEEEEEEEEEEVVAESVINEDGEAWYCEMHPQERYASCDAPVVLGGLGPAYQISALPDYVAPPMRPPMRPVGGGLGGGSSAGGVANGAESNSFDVFDACSSDDDEDDVDDDERVAIHARLRPLSYDAIAADAPSTPPASSSAPPPAMTRARGGDSKKRPQSKRVRAKKKDEPPDLPCGDSQRPDFEGYAEEEEEEDNDERELDGILDEEVDAKFLPRPTSANKRRKASPASSSSRSTLSRSAAGSP